jgi:anti-sigma B factor antagonist
MGDATRSEEPLPLALTVSRPRAGVCVVHLTGELDAATAPLVARYLREQTSGRPADLVLNLASVGFLAATGVGLIITALRNDAGIHGRLHLIGVTGNRAVERVLDLTGVRAVLDVHDTLDALLDRLDRR